MSSRQERYAERQYLRPGEREIDPSTYNLIIGGTLAYGFIVNCLMVATCADFAFKLFSNSVVFYILYFAMVFIGTMMVNCSDNPVVSFIGYNFIVVPLGLVLTVLLNLFSLAGYDKVIATAFGITTIVTIGMMMLSSAFPRFFLSLGKTLFITLLLTIVVEIIMMIAGASLGFIDYVVVLIFCGYIGYDWARANACAKTVDNAVDSAAELYVDIINLFVRILSILARSND